MSYFFMTGPAISNVRVKIRMFPETKVDLFRMDDTVLRIMEQKTGAATDDSPSQRVIQIPRWSLV